MKDSDLQKADGGVGDLVSLTTSLTREPSRARGDGCHPTLVLCDLEKCQN